MKPILFAVFAFWWAGAALAQSPSRAEPQISFAREDRPHDYYVAQAGLWWEAVQRDPTDESAWYNYYRACRNAQGSANWSTDFVDEAPYLRLGDDIVALMEEHIPDTFTYHFVKGSTGGVAPEAGDHLMKAYALNPDFAPLLPSVVTYATSTHDAELRREANARWYRKDDVPLSLLHYGYNTLQSVGERGILLTEHDNDTYPVWMLQDVKDIRPDVLVINIDFLLYDGYRETIFSELGVAPFRLDTVDVNEYETNWRNAVEHLLGNYRGDRPIHIGLSVSEQWYGAFADRLQVVGLTKAFQSGSRDNATLLREVFVTDYLRVDYEHTSLRPRIDEMNVGYLVFFDAVYDDLGPSRRREVARLARAVLDRREDYPRRGHYLKRFAK